MGDTGWAEFLRASGDGSGGAAALVRGALSEPALRALGLAASEDGAAMDVVDGDSEPADLGLKSLAVSLGVGGPVLKMGLVRLPHGGSARRPFQRTPWRIPVSDVLQCPDAAWAEAERDESLGKAQAENSVDADGDEEDGPQEVTVQRIVLHAAPRPPHELPLSAWRSAAAAGLLDKTHVGAADWVDILQNAQGPGCGDFVLAHVLAAGGGVGDAALAALATRRSALAEAAATPKDLAATIRRLGMARDADTGEVRYDGVALERSIALSFHAMRNARSTGAQRE